MNAATGWRRERDDLCLLTAIGVTTTLVWIAVLGWDGSALLGDRDAGLYLALVDRLRAASGDWRAAWYVHDVLGGTTLVGVYGAPPVFTLAAQAGWSSVAAYDAAVLSTQIMLGFLGVRASVALAAWADDRHVAPGVASMALASTTFAFAPFLGWRFENGHLNLVWGLTAFVAALAVVADGRRGLPGVALSLVASCAFLHAFQSHSFQMLLYGAVFGVPVFAAVVATQVKRRRAASVLRAVAPLCLLMGGALLLSWPKLSAMMAHVRSSDSQRTGSEDIVFSYLRGESADWWSSLAWTHGWWPSGRPAEVSHEVHLAWGPPLLLLLALPAGRLRGLTVAVALTLAASVAFASGVSWVATPLLELPLMRAFRVPHRAVMVPSLALLVVVMAMQWPRARAVPQRSWGAALLALSVLALLPWRVAEPVAWVVALAALVASRWESVATARALVARAAPVSLAALAASAFAEKVPRPLLTRASLIDAAAAKRAAIRALAPELSEPLARGAVSWRARPHGPNTAPNVGVATLDGYGYPLSRFAALVRATGGEIEGAGTIVQIHPGNPAFAPLSALYDVRALIDAGGADGGLRVIEPPRPIGPAWRSTRIEPVDSIASLGGAIRSLRGVTSLRRAMLVVVTDPKRPASVDVNGGCADASVGAVAVTSADLSIRVSVGGPGPCPLTIATNYLEAMRAEARLADGTSAPIPVFPAYGALAGMLVPAGATEVLLRTELAR